MDLEIMIKILGLIEALKILCYIVMIIDTVYFTILIFNWRRNYKNAISRKR